MIAQLVWRLLLAVLLGAAVLTVLARFEPTPPTILVERL